MKMSIEKVWLLKKILEEPFKKKTHYVLYAKSHEQEMRIRELFRELEEEGLIIVEKDGQGRRVKISEKGLKYLASIRS